LSSCEDLSDLPPTVINYGVSYRPEVGGSDARQFDHEGKLTEVSSQ
jgi:hypothetical protein